MRFRNLTPSHRNDLRTYTCIEDGRVRIVMKQIMRLDEGLDSKGAAMIGTELL